MKKVTKFKSVNLLGETPEEEKARYRKIAKIYFKKTKDPIYFLNLPYTIGATKSQLKRRRDSLAKSGMKTKPIKTIREMLRYAHLKY